MTIPKTSKIQEQKTLFLFTFDKVNRIYLFEEKRSLFFRKVQQHKTIGKLVSLQNVSPIDLHTFEIVYVEINALIKCEGNKNLI